MPALQTNLVVTHPEAPLAEVESKLVGIEGLPVVDDQGKVGGCWRATWALPGWPQMLQLPCSSCLRSLTLRLMPCPALYPALPCPLSCPALHCSDPLCSGLPLLQLVGVVSRKDFKKAGSHVKAGCRACQLPPAALPPCPSPALRCTAFSCSNTQHPRHMPFLSILPSPVTFVSSPLDRM